MAITSSVGPFSGINSGQIIDQLLALEARPKTTAQTRIAGYQKIQAAFLDVSSKTSTLRNLAQGFRLNTIFRSAQAHSATETVVTASATNGAPAGQYSVTVARLASSQQTLSRGFADSTIAGVGVSQIVVEDARGRMDTDTPLSQLNGGNGVQRGRIVVTDSAGGHTTVDLTRASTLNDVVTSINEAGTGKFRVAISSDGNGLTLTDTAGGIGSIGVASEGSVTTAADLGLNSTAAGSIVGARINRLGANTRLSSLNDNLGVSYSNTGNLTNNYDFEITDRAGGSHKVSIGDVYDGTGVRTGAAATTLGDVVNRINAAGGGAITAEVVPDNLTNGGASIRLVDHTAGSGSIAVVEKGSGSTAADLGILGSVNNATLVGTRLQSKLNSVSMTRLLGGTTIAPDNVDMTTRDGTNVHVAVSAADVTGSVTDFIADFNNQAGGKVTLAVDSTGTRFSLTDNTTGSGSFEATGTVADALGLQQGPTTSATIVGSRTQRQWIGRSTLLSDLNGRRGIGEGRIEIVTAGGPAVQLNITSSQRTVGDLVDQINSNLDQTVNKTRARVNDTGDGILIETTDGTAATPISIRDISGSVARSLNLNSTSTGTGAANRVDGSYERVITVHASDTLTQLSEAINSAGVGLSSSIINDGSANPFRLSLTSRASGTAGALSIDTGGVDIGLSTVAQARNALLFYGSEDPTRALAIESTSNSVTNAVPGVTLNLVSSSTTPVNVSVTSDNDKIVEQVGKFVTAFNALLNSIDSKSTYDADSNVRGVLLGDSTSQELRRSVLDLIQRKAQGVNSQYQYLFDAGVQLNGDGKLELKEDKLRAALERDPAGVADLFAGRVQAANSSSRNILDSAGNVIGSVVENVAGAVTTRGVFEILADQLENFTRATDGKLARKSTLLDTQIKAQNDQIARIDTRLASRRTILQNQFSAMEAAIGKLQSQQGSISQIAAIR
jgi:flagellar hook-associated protein 2